MEGFFVARSAFEAGLPDAYEGQGVEVAIKARPRGIGPLFLFGPAFVLSWRSGATARGRISIATWRAEAIKQWTARAGTMFVIAMLTSFLGLASTALLVIPATLLCAAFICWVQGSRYGVQADLTRDKQLVQLTGLDDEQVATWSSLRVPSPG